jgi:hypothetical protein
MKKPASLGSEAGFCAVVRDPRRRGRRRKALASS